MPAHIPRFRVIEKCKPPHILEGVCQHIRGSFQQGWSVLLLSFFIQGLQNLMSL